jgi:hypothetical protein
MLFVCMYIRFKAFLLFFFFPFWIHRGEAEWIVYLGTTISKTAKAFCAILHAHAKGLSVRS